MSKATGSMRVVFDKYIHVLFLSLGLALLSGTAAAKNHLVILSGQSNMVFLDEKKYFNPLVIQAFPDDTVFIAKYSKGGQPIRRWDKDWLDARGKSRNADGLFYDRLLDEVRSTLGKARPDTVTFVWMQGEADANGGFGQVYRQSLERVISRIKHDLDLQEMAVVIGRISDWADGTHKQAKWQVVREAQQAVAEAQKYGAWVNTDDLNDWHSKNPKERVQRRNLLHYTRDGYEKFGKRLADATIELIQKMQQ